jgi:hypothetical protein
VLVGFPTDCSKTGMFFSQSSGCGSETAMKHAITLRLLFGRRTINGWASLKILLLRGTFQDLFFCYDKSCFVLFSIFPFMFIPMSHPSFFDCEYQLEPTQSGIKIGKIKKIKQ